MGDVVTLEVNGKKSELKVGESVTIHKGDTVVFQDELTKGAFHGERGAFAASIDGPGIEMAGGSFNASQYTNDPSQSCKEDRIKTIAAALINEIDEIGLNKRLKSLGITAAETSAMWGVKAQTHVK